MHHHWCWRAAVVATATAAACSCSSDLLTCRASRHARALSALPDVLLVAPRVWRRLQRAARWMYRTPARGPAPPPVPCDFAASCRMRGAQRRAGRMLRAMAPPLFAPAEAAAPAACASRLGMHAGMPRSGAPQPRALAPPPPRAAPWGSGGAGPLRGALAGHLAASSRDLSAQSAAAAAAPAPLHAGRDASPGAEPARAASAASKAAAAAARQASAAHGAPTVARPVARRRTMDEDLKKLRELPGVGPKNAQLLIAKGLGNVDSLQKLYDNDFRRDKDEMVSFLTKDVQMRSRAHAGALAARLDELYAREEDGRLADKARHARPRLTICVEGNISAGKTTFLQSIVGQSPRLGPNVHLVPEPVDRWTSIPDMAEIASPGGPGSADAAQQEHNILGEFYKNPARWGYTFQNWVFFTRFMQERNSNAAAAAAFAADGAGPAGLGLARSPGGILLPGDPLARGGIRPDAVGGMSAEELKLLAGGGGQQHASAEDMAKRFRLMERSVFSDRLVFVEALRDNSQLTPMELAVYRNWFEFMMEDKPQLVPDAFIYLRATAEVCFDRMRSRNRNEEGGVSLDYLDLLHKKHEGWFLSKSLRDKSGLILNDNAASAGGGGFVIDETSQLHTMIHSYTRHSGVSLSVWEEQSKELAAQVAADLIPDSIRGQVVFMPQVAAGRPLHERAMTRIPALILDCNARLDVVNDAPARERYAEKVADFYSFVEALHKTVYSVLGAPGRAPPLPAEQKHLELLKRRIASVKRQAAF